MAVRDATLDWMLDALGLISSKYPSESQDGLEAWKATRPEVLGQSVADLEKKVLAQQPQAPTAGPEAGPPKT